MKTKHSSVLLFVATLCLFLVSSCSKSETENVATVEEVTSTAENDQKANSLSDAVVSISDTLVNSLDANNYAVKSFIKKEMRVSHSSTTNGYTITIERSTSNPFPKTITVDFGIDGYVNALNDTLKGKIIITLSGRPTVPGTIMVIKPVDFFFNNINVKGLKTVTYNQLVNNLPSVSVDVIDTIIFANKAAVMRHASRTRTKVSENGTPRIFRDDEFSITGSATGINAKGNSYATIITSPLVCFNNYPYFVKGIVQITTKKRTATIDYGDGTKDNKATLTVNGTSKTITLGK